MSSRAPIGLLAINEVECCTNQGFKNIVPDTSICDIEYLYYYLAYHIREIESLGSGTTFKEVSKSSLLDFELRLPNLFTHKEKQQNALQQRWTPKTVDEAQVTHYGHTKKNLPQSLPALRKRIHRLHIGDSLLLAPLLRPCRQAPQAKRPAQIHRIRPSGGTSGLS